VQVFGQYSQQEEVFEATGRPMVDEVLQARHCRTLTQLLHHPRTLTP